MVLKRGIRSSTKGLEGTIEMTLSCPVLNCSLLHPTVRDLDHMKEKGG